jgi:predicted DNA-binding transcriptional regulator AlpA
MNAPLRPHREAQDRAPFRNDPAVSTADAAAVLGLSRKTLTNWRWQGKGPRFQKTPGHRGSVRYPLSELRAWRAENLRRSTSDQGGGNAR